MSATRLILLRHGETEWNLENRYQGHLDSPLTATGVAQARALAQRAAQHTIAALYSSDLGRARQTADAVAAATRLSVIVESRLRERHLGVFQGRLKAELREKFPDEYHRFKTAGPDHQVPGGESSRHSFARVIACLDEIMRRHVGQQIAVVSHGGTVSSLLRHALGIPLESPRRFELPNASWNVFRWDDGKWFLETWGDVSHLQA